ncbi:MAG: AI-2E family transporter [Myxococcota bacterium]|nr:AI-2E family transporter [Myxococcota bacterium]
MRQTHFDVELFRRAFLLLLVTVISIAFLIMIQGFLTALLLAAIFSALCQPLHSLLLRLFGGRAVLASLATILILLIGIIGPLLGFLGIVTSQAVEVSGAVQPWIQEQISGQGKLSVERFFDLPDELEPYESQVYAKAGELTSRVGEFLLNSLAAATRGTANFFFMLFIMLYAMFFFLRDGSKILDKILYYMPLESDDEYLMVDKFVSVTRATLKGSLVIGIVQGGLAGLAFAVVGIEGAAFWGTVMAVLSIIPGIGTALVWVPAAIYLAVNGQSVASAGLTFWCVVVVGTVDNVLRPTLVGRDTQMSDLLIMLSTLGGLLLFGPTGLVVGPIIAALFVTVWEIYGEAFSAYLPATENSDGPSPPAGKAALDETTS